LSDGMIKLLRFAWYLISRLFVWVAIVPLILLSFFAAMDYMNVRILTSDGLEVRAGVIISGDDPTPLSKVFSKRFLENDAMLNSEVYRAYIVSDFDYDLTIPLAFIMPWKDSVVLRITEEVNNIDAKIYASAENTANIEDTPPAWKNATYDLTLVRYENNWRITDMQIIETEPEDSPIVSEETDSNK